jgi:AbrB family looped-hinge helix DNA binding protein
VPQSTVTAKGQTTLPRPVRAALGLAPGDRVRYVILDGGEVRLLKEKPVMELAGLLRRPGQTPVSLEAMEDAIAAAAAEGAGPEAEPGDDEPA